MNPLNKQIAIRIGLVSLLLASITSPIAWMVARENAEDSIVSLAYEETGRLINHLEVSQLNESGAAEQATHAANSIIGGMFDIAEIYDDRSKKIAEALTPQGKAVEKILAKHDRPGSVKAVYETLETTTKHWVLRVFVPLRSNALDTKSPITGYFEGVRVVPQWQQDQIFRASWISVLMVCLASLACGAMLYPVMVHLSTDNVRKAREVLDSHIAMMEALGRAIARRDSDTGAHNYRVAWLAARVGRQMGLSKTAMQELIVGSFLHDVGKIGIPDKILLKPGKLDPEEIEVMRTHVHHGENILHGIGWLAGASEVVAAHHEKWNGTGYPRGLAGAIIPLAARIFSVVDVFDALCSKRPYKEAMDFENAMKILEKDTGTHFDPEVMAAFSHIANGLYERLENTSEDEARVLMEEEVRNYFDEETSWLTKR